MADVNAQLKALTANAGYQALFPATDVGAVNNIGRVFKRVLMDVTIPPSQDVQQTLSINFGDALAAAPVKMFLKSTGDQAMKDYSTISQYYVGSDSMVITRLYSNPTESIDVTLLFDVAITGV